MAGLRDSPQTTDLKDRPMKVAGLFAGMGGFELGLGAAGHEAVMLCEIWEPARAVLAARFPEIPCKPDVTGLRSLPADAELLVAGFPCQDLSQAGSRPGIGGTRSGLVEHIFDCWTAVECPGSSWRTCLSCFTSGKAKHWTHSSARSSSGAIAGLIVSSTRSRFCLSGDSAFFSWRLRQTSIPPMSYWSTMSIRLRTRRALSSHAHGFYWTEGVRGLGLGTRRRSDLEKRVDCRNCIPSRGTASRRTGHNAGHSRRRAAAGIRCELDRTSRDVGCASPDGRSSAMQLPSLSPSGSDRA